LLLVEVAALVRFDRRIVDDVLLLADLRRCAATADGKRSTRTTVYRVPSAPTPAGITRVTQQRGRLQIASFSRTATTAASSSVASARASIAAASVRFPSTGASVRGAGGLGGGVVDPPTRRTAAAAHAQHRRHARRIATSRREHTRPPAIL
jgi:hypothetical protein